MICRTYAWNELRKYRYVVILSVYHGKILLSRHKERTTWETQGGHIEAGETPFQAAERELFEESGARAFDMEPLCDYWAGDLQSGDGANGMVFTAHIHTLGPMPDCEMAEVGMFGILPQNLTYPEITPVLFARIGHYFYKKADCGDLDALVKMRTEVLRAANKLSEKVDLAEVETESEKYYKSALENQMHIAYLVYDAQQVIGAGGVSFYQVLPAYHNANGWKAYIMNMYTNPCYRRRGIARNVLELLIKEAEDRGITQITLEATQEGRPLYEACGFVQMQNEMEWSHPAVR